MKGWILPAAIIVSIEYIVALIIGARVGFHYSIPFASYLIVGMTFVGIAASIAIVVRLFQYARTREPHPARKLVAEAPRFFGTAAGIVLVSLQMAVLTWTKVMLPVASPFWADAVLADLDHLIFRAEPWVIAKQLFGWATPMIDRAYITWAPVKFATLIVLLALPESRTKSRAMLSYFLIMASGALGQYLLSSAGPIFYSRFGFGDRFAALTVEPWVATASAFLWHDYLRSGGDIGGGISAMPSLHVAIALWVALVIRAYVPRIAVVGFFYFSLILIGSVLLGWHYAVDSLAGIAIVILAWRCAAAADPIRLSRLQPLWGKVRTSFGRSPSPSNSLPDAIK